MTRCRQRPNGLSAVGGHARRPRRGTRPLSSVDARAQRRRVRVARRPAVRAAADARVRGARPATRPRPVRARGDNAIWPRFFQLRGVRPEPTEHARYVLAAARPAAGRPAACWRCAGGACARACRALLEALAQWCSSRSSSPASSLSAIRLRNRVHRRQGRPDDLLHDRRRSSSPLRSRCWPRARAAAPGGVAAARTRDARDAGTAGARARAAALLTLAYLLSAFNTEGTINVAHAALWDHVSFWIDEAFSILNGQAPLVDFHAQYGHLWAYVAAGGAGAVRHLARRLRGDHARRLPPARWPSCS